MCLSQPTFRSITNGEDSLFLSWSHVNNATEYEIELETTYTGIKTIYSTTSTNFLIKALENGRFYSVTVTALNGTERSLSSFSYIARPKLRQSLATLRAMPAEEEGRVYLRWTSTPTDFGFQVDRCDIGQATGYKRIAWISNNAVTAYEDQTNCDLSTHICSGHYYTVRFRDTAWEYGGGIVSKKVFCMSAGN